MGTGPRPSKAFREDYPEAAPVLLYRGNERFLRDGVMVVPVEEYLRAMVPGRALGGGLRVQ